MKNIFKRKISEKTIYEFTRIIRKSSKLLTIIVVISLILSYCPWNLIKAYSINNIEDDRSVVENEEFKGQEIDPSIVPIDFEDVDKRNINEKHYRKIDGTYEVAIYNSAIHYQEKGQWKDIDNTLIDGNNYVENKNNILKIKFPKSIDDNKSISIKYDDYKIDWNILNIDKTNISIDDSNKLQVKDIMELPNINQKVTYYNINKNVNLEYLIKGDSLKENFILNEYIENFSIKLDIKVKNLKLINNEGKMIFINKRNEPVFNLEKLYMVDASNEISTDVDLNIIELKKDLYRVSINPNNEWLSKAKYPVIVDPSLESSTSSIKDTYIDETNEFSNYSEYPFMKISSGNSNRDVLMKFDIPSSVMNKVITYSHLTIHNRYEPILGKQLNIYENTSDFNITTVNWRTRPNFNNRVIDYFIMEEIDGYDYPYYKFDITRSVKKWQTEGISNVPGFTITDDEDTNGSLLYIYSTENEAFVPSITIGYEEPDGLKDYWTYTSQNMGLIGTGYISDYTGNLTFVRNDFNIRNDYMPFSLDFYFNSNDRYINIGYGNGWKTNYNYKINFNNINDHYYMSMPDGNIVYFMNMDSKYIAEDGSRSELIIEKNSEGNINYKVYTINHIEYCFKEDGRLNYILKIQNNRKITIEYEDNISQKIKFIKDDIGNNIKFSYLNGNIYYIDLNLIRVDKSEYRVEKKYYYYNQNNLIRITSKYNYNNEKDYTTTVLGSFYYDYNSDNLLIKAYSDIDNNTVEYIYTFNRVTQVKYTDFNVDNEITHTKNLGFFDIVYDFNRTIYTDFEGNSIFYLFDNYGHTINIIDQFGNCSFYKYSSLFTNSDDLEDFPYDDPSNGYDVIINPSPNYYNNHKLIVETPVINQKYNYIYNHGFELGDLGWEYEGNTSINNYDYHKVLGNYSLELEGNSSATQQITLEAGYYTICGWIKNEYNAPGAYIDILNIAGDKYINKIYHSYGWEKYQLVFQLTEATTIVIKLINETQFSRAFFDNIQLVKGIDIIEDNGTNDSSVDGNNIYYKDIVDSRYNVINNCSFENGDSNWILNNSEIVPINEDNHLNGILKGYAIHINGDGTTRKYFEHDITQLVTNNETYVISGWAKADAVPNKANMYSYLRNDGRFFGFIVEAIIKGDSIENDYITKRYYFSFNPAIDDWQYQSYSFKVPGETISVKLKGIYQGEGDAYFDNIQLYHDKIANDYSYDTYGNLISSSCSNGVEVIYGYNENNDIISIKQNGVETKIDRDSSTSVVQSFSKNNVKVSLEYDLETNQLISTTTGDLNKEWFKTSIGYSNNFQYKTSETDEFGNKITYSVDESISAVTKIIDAYGNQENIQYNDYGQVIEKEFNSITDDSNNKRVNSIQYDSKGNLLKIILDNYYYEFVYDDLEKIIGVKIGEIPVETYEYLEKVKEIDNSIITYYTNLIEKQIFSNGDYIGYEYNDENRVKRIRYNFNVRYEYEYDINGNIAIYKDIYNDNIYFYSYDLAGRITKVTDRDGNTIIYNYNSEGKIDDYTYKIDDHYRSVSYYYNYRTGEFDYLLYLVKSDDGTYNFIRKYYNYSDDALKRLENIELVIGSTIITKNFIYDNSKVVNGNSTNRVYKVIYNKDDQYFLSYTYTYDKKNNITKIETEELEYWSKTTYVYDGFNQLIRENHTNSEGFNCYTMVFTYDSNGNIMSNKKYNYTTLDNINLGIPLEEKRYLYDGSWKDQIIKIEYYKLDKLSYYVDLSYDNIGNIISNINSINLYNNTYYTWDGKQLNQITRIGNRITFKYNDQGIRTEKYNYSNFVKTNYYLDGNRVLLEKTSSSGEVIDMIYYTYDVNGALISMNLNGDEYFYITNQQGDIIELVDINGNRVVSYKYDAWGNIISQTDNSGIELANKNPYRYRGYRYDVETSLYYCNSRYYNPEWGRWLNADDVSFLDPSSVNGLNLYAYCGNNPVMRSDPSGHFWDTVFDLVFIAWDIYNLCTNEGYKDWKNWAALGLDLVFTAIPFVTGGGKVVKLANVGDDLTDLSKVTVIGETMTRVQTVSQFVNATDNLYDGFKAYDRLSDMGKAGTVLAEVGGKASNIAWLYGKVQSGYKIVDIGIDVGRSARSSSYMAERIFLSIWKYRNGIKFVGHGLDYIY